MKKCPHCHASIEESAHFCLYCMTSLEEKQTVGNPIQRRGIRIAAIVSAIVLLLAAGVWLGSVLSSDSPETQDVTGAVTTTTALGTTAAPPAMNDAVGRPTQTTATEPMTTISTGTTATAASVGTDTYTYINGFWCCHEYTGSNDTCEACGSPVVAQIGNVKYHSLGRAVAAYGGSDYIQMRSSTVESVVNVAKKIALDLSGKTVAALKVNSGGTLNGMDTTTNAFGIGGTAGSITKLTVNGGTVDEIYQYLKDGVGKKKYIACEEDGGISFHRFDLGIKDYTFYCYTTTDGEGNPVPTGAMTFTAAFKGDSDALSAMVDKGFQINDSRAFASKTHNNTTANLETLKSGDNTIGCTLTGTLSGFNLSEGPEFDEEFSVEAIIKTKNDEFSEANFTHGTDADSMISFVEALEIVSANLKESEPAQAAQIEAFLAVIANTQG